MTFVKTALFHKAGEGSGGGGGGDQHNLGWYATESALTTAHATATDGDWAIVGATDTVWVWDSDSTAWKDTGQAGIELPDQTGHSGEFLITNGSSASWSDTLEKHTVKNTVDTATIYGGVTLITFKGKNANNQELTFGSIGSYKQTGLQINGTLYTGSIIPANGGVSDLGSRGVGLNRLLFRRVYAEALGTKDDYAITIPNVAGSMAVQVSTVPTAGSTLEGQIYQYIGATDSTYTNGYFYKCVSDGGNPATYSWTAVQVQAGGGNYLPLSGGTMTGDITLSGQTAILFSSTGGNGYIRASGYTYTTELGYKSGNSYTGVFALDFGAGAIRPTNNASYQTLGRSSFKWGNVYTVKINNGADITVPAVAGEMAVKQVNTTITLAAADWSGGSQTVTVTGMTATGVVLVSPDPTDQSAYTSAGIICTAQAANSLTFTCSTTPSADIDVNVVML